MTSIYFDPAQFEAPSEREPAEQLIVNGRYYLPPLDDPTGKRRSLQRVTNFIKQLSETAGLERWKLRMTVIGLARDERRYDLATSIDPDTERGKRELDELIEECIDLAQAGPSGGNITGTALHNYTDDRPGEYPIRVRDKWVPLVENYQRALRDAGLRAVPGLSERLVVSERYGTCGRLDDVYEDPFGVLRVGDRKSQKEFRTWWEIGAQLALYQGSDAMWNETECRWEDMPDLADDYAHVAWMPLKHPSERDGVTIYDIPLEGPREILEWCQRVRTLRTEARKWGRERQLDEFARIARDIRDAETHEDLRAINAGIVSSLTGWPDELRLMAAKRWEEIAAQPRPEPALSTHNLADQAPPTPLNDGVRVTHVSAPAPPAGHADDFECRFDGRLASQHPVDIPGRFHCITPERRPVEQLATALAQPTAEGFEQEWQRFAAMFVSPAQDATFPADGDGGRPGGEVPAAGGTELVRPALSSVVTVPQEMLEATPADFVNGVVRHELEQAPIIGETSVTFDHDACAQPLDAVPIKILKEIVTRAHNSQSSRGRVRLLNDLGKKYEKYEDALLPALLAEWLAIDGGPEWDTKLGELVKNTGGSTRRAAEKNDAGPVTLTQFLATKGEGALASATEGGAAPAQGDDEVQLKDSADISNAIVIPSLAHLAQEVRKPYAGLADGPNAGKHSIARLVELAKDARNGAERAKVFHEVTRRGAWTGAIAEEINEHYRAHGYATVDFGPYFEAKALPDGAMLAATPAPADWHDPNPDWVDGPDWLSTSPEEAVRMLDGATDMAAFNDVWQRLSTAPCWTDQSVQEALMRNMIRVK